MDPALPRTPPPLDGTDAAMAETHASDVPGVDARHFHHYEICLREDGVTPHELGRGAMGASYKARDVNLDTPVAIKIIGEGLPTQVQARERFRREARAAAALRHPHVASVFHFGETPTGTCFYAMEFIEGETLLAKVQREGPLPSETVVEIALQVTDALIAADERGLVHRDLKPANLMLVAAPPGRTTLRTATTHLPGAPGPASASNRITVKVIDFGLAKAVASVTESASGEAALTQTGGFLGTPAFASPEQAEGANVDARSDIYSLGVTLWFLLTGKVPFTGRSLSEIYDRQLHRPLPASQLADCQVHAALAELLKSMLAADPSQRPASPHALYDALARCREEMGGPPATAFRERPRRWLSTRRLPWLLAGLALLAMGGGAALLLPRKAAVPVAEAVPAAPPKSIAVLPLEDLSAARDDTFFADGIQDDLLNSLAKIKDLKVISRSSVMGYRQSATASRPLRQIGQELGVATVLEGSVRRAPGRVIVAAALIDVRDGRQLWSERYDRTLADALTLQGELATEIAAALQARLSPAERTRVEDRPTGNADAYVLYLRARDYQTRPTGLLQDYQTAEQLYGQALALDPDFALAHARLACTLAYTYLNFLPTAEIHDRARREAEEALRLRPDAGEAYLARGLCLYWTEKNYPAALRELETAAKLLPGSAEADFFAGAIRRRQGFWTQSIASMKHSLARDPRDVQNAREIMLSECMVRDWPAATRDAERAVALAPDLTMLQLEKAYLAVWAGRDVSPLYRMLAAAPAGVDPDGEITFARWDAAMLDRDFAGAERAANAGATASVETVFGAVLPREYLLGCAALARGDAAAARTLFEAARPAMEAEVRNVPLDAFRQAHLGVLYAFLGRKDDALRQGRHAVELLPEARDAYYGPSASALLAMIYARTGETGEALALIERLLRTPGALSPSFEASITLNDLRLRWQWDPLRADPRFQKLLAAPEPKTVYQ